jgi:hypothetical protein
MDYAEQMNFDDKDDYEFLNEPEGRTEFLKRLAGSSYISDELKKRINIELAA